MNQYDDIIKAYKRVISESAYNLNAVEKRKLLKKESEEILDKLKELRPDLTNVEQMLLTLIMRGYGDYEKDLMVLLANGGEECKKPDDDIDEFNKVLDAFDKSGVNADGTSKLSFKNFKTMCELKHLLFDTDSYGRAINRNKKAIEAIVNSDYLLHADNAYILANTWTRYETPLSYYSRIEGMSEEYYDRIFYLIGNCDMALDKTDPVKSKAVSKLYGSFSLNKSVPSKIVEKLFDLNDTSVLQYLAYRSDLNDQMLQKLLSTNDSNVYCALAASKTTLPENAQKAIVNLNSGYINSYLVKRKDLTAEILGHFLKDTAQHNTLIRYRNGKPFPEAALRIAASSDDRTVKLRIMRKDMQLIPKDIIEKFKNDSDALVRKRAVEYENTRMNNEQSN
jgi:tetratricopeptide (TPR) repeat protein